MVKYMKKFKSFVDEKIMDRIYPGYKNNGFDLFQYAVWKCEIDGLISAAYFFSPDIIQFKGYILLKDLWGREEKDYEQSIIDLQKQYANDKRMIEMHINTCSIGDFFVGSNNILMDDEKILEQFGKTLVYYWGKRAKELFPDKNIIVTLGNNLMGEYGLCITMYEYN